MDPTNTPLTPELKGSGDGRTWSGLRLAAATAAEWLAYRRRRHDPVRHALIGLARYIRWKP